MNTVTNDLPELARIHTNVIQRLQIHPLNPDLVRVRYSSTLKLHGRVLQLAFKIKLHLMII
ncbi:hypothetical protein D3C77_783470 [compost metagenome]